MQTPVALDYATPATRLTLPWWMAVSALLVYLACALTGVFAVMVLMQGRLVLGAMLVLLPLLLAALETDFVRGRDGDAATLLLLLDVPVMIGAGLFGALVLVDSPDNPFIDVRWAMAALSFSISTIALFIFVTHLRRGRFTRARDRNVPRRSTIARRE